MSAQIGIVSVVADQDRGAAVDSAWATAVKALSPRIQFVRGSISADKHGHVDVALLKSGLQAFKNVGLPVYGVLEGSLAGPGLMQNAVLGWKGDAFKNPWIDSYTNNAITLMQQLGPLAPEHVWILNEGNVQAAPNPLGSGRVIPQLVMGQAPDPLKPEAMAPEVWWSVMYHSAYWLKKEVPAVTGVYPGALSLDLTFLTGLYDLWVGMYVDTGLGYLSAHGVKGVYPWSGFCLNTEGTADPSYSSYLAQNIPLLKEKYGLAGPTVLGEFGVPNGGEGKPLDTAAVQSTFAALSGMSDLMAFYAAQADGGYGCFTREIERGEIVPGEALEWASALGPMLDSISL